MGNNFHAVEFEKKIQAILYCLDKMTRKNSSASKEQRNSSHRVLTVLTGKKKHAHEANGSAVYQSCSQYKLELVVFPSYKRIRHVYSDKKEKSYNIIDVGFL